MDYCIIVFLLLAAYFNSNDVLANKHHRKHHAKSNGHKIVGGHEANIQNYPYQAFLLLGKGDDNYQCGGSIISGTYILTAAHCFEDKGIETVQARVGSTDKFYGGEQISGSFETHSKYDKLTKNYDIALVKLAQKISLDGVNTKAVEMADKDSVVPPDSTIKLSGWGATSEGGDTSETLRAVEVPSLSNDECSKDEPITETQFCGGYKEGGKDTCQGDSGGPAVLSDTGKLVGVVSAGYGCGRPGKPGIYTNISVVRDWINERTGL